MSVWVGPDLPKYAHASLRQFVRSHIGEVILIAESDPQIAGVTWANSKLLTSERFDEFAANFGLDLTHRNGLWLRAYERFFLIAEYAKRYGVSRGFLIELDSVLLGLEGVAEELDSRGTGLFVPQASETAVVATCAYWNQLDALSLMESFFVAEGSLLNEMEALALALARNERWIKPLPSEIQLFEKSSPHETFNDTLGIFDAAGLGTWYFGGNREGSRATIFNKSVTRATSQLPISTLRVRFVGHKVFIRAGKSPAKWRRVRILHVPSKISAATGNHLGLRILLLASRLPIRVPVVPRSFGAIEKTIKTTLKFYERSLRFLPSKASRRIALLISRLSFRGQVNLGSTSRLSLIGSSLESGASCAESTGKREHTNIGLRFAPTIPGVYEGSALETSIVWFKWRKDEIARENPSLEAMLLQVLNSFGIPARIPFARLVLESPEAWPVILAKGMLSGIVDIDQVSGLYEIEEIDPGIGKLPAYVCSKKDVRSFQQSRAFLGAHNLEFSWNFCPSHQIYSASRLDNLFPQFEDLRSWMESRNSGASAPRLPDLYFAKQILDGEKPVIWLGR